MCKICTISVIAWAFSVFLKTESVYIVSLKAIAHWVRNFRVCFSFLFLYSLSFPIKKHATDAKTQKIEPDPKNFLRTKASEAVYTHDWHNLRSCLYFNLRKRWTFHWCSQILVPDVYLLTPLSLSLTGIESFTVNHLYVFSYISNGCRGYCSADAQPNCDLNIFTESLHQQKSSC